MDSKIALVRIKFTDNAPVTYREALYGDEDLSEIENLAKGGPIAYADYFILNNGNMDDEINRLKEILKEIGE